MQFLSKVPLELLKKIRKLLLVTVILLTISLIGWRGNDYLSVKGLRTEAKRLADQAKYSEAVDRLEESETKWTTETIRNQIKDDIEEYTKFSESNKFFEEAKIKYDTGDYQEAIELFNKIPFGHVNYNSAQGWLILAEKKLAEGENKEPGSVAGVTTQASDIENNFSEVLNTVAPKGNDTRQLNAIKDLFARIGSLNGQLAVLKYIGVATTSPCNIEKWSKQYLSNGEYNPNFILDPAKQNELYQQCLMGQSSSSLSGSADVIIREIKNINKEIEAIIVSCSTSQCSESYWAAVRTLEAQGYIVR